MKKGDYKLFCSLVNEITSTKTWKEEYGNNKRLAAMLGVSERTLYRWLAGDTAVPLTVIILLKLIVK